MASKTGTFQDAREWAQAQGITSHAEYRTRAKRSDFPGHLRANLSRYPGYTTFGDFIGRYRTLAEASQWAQDEQIRTVRAWKARTERQDFPADIRKNPRLYPGFVSMTIFLNNGRRVGHTGPRRKIMANRTCWPYTQLKQWAKEHGVVDRQHFASLGKSGRLPHEVPSNPAAYYKDEWQGWARFLDNAQPFSGSSKVEQILKHGLTNVLTIGTDRANIDVLDGQEIVHLDVDILDRSRRLIVEYDGQHWHRDRVEHDRLKSARLKANGWAVIRVREAPLTCLDPIWDVQVEYKETKPLELIQAVLDHLEKLMRIGLVTDPELADRVRQAKANPVTEAELNTIRAAGWRPYVDASAYAVGRCIKSQQAYHECTQQPGWPSDMPVAPNQVYGEWKGWVAFLKSNPKRGGGKKRTYLPINGIREYARSRNLTSSHAWNINRKNLPIDIPTCPDRALRDFVSWPHLLGVGEHFHVCMLTWHTAYRASRAQASNDGAMLNAVG
jgi:very-short-patch-repair endonuclease